ncbi:MAG: hypothetical protein AAFN70_10865 [Planctomycetota bacterium]
MLPTPATALIGIHARVVEPTLRIDRPHVGTAPNLAAQIRVDIANMARIRVDKFRVDKFRVEESNIAKISVGRFPRDHPNPLEGVRRYTATAVAVAMHHAGGVVVTATSVGIRTKTWIAVFES